MPAGRGGKSHPAAPPPSPGTPRIGVPGFGPCFVRKCQVEFEVGGFQGVAEPVAHPHGQWFRGDEDVGMTGTHPSGFGQGPAGDQVMDVRMITQIPCPGLQDAGHAQLAAKIARVCCQISQRSGAFAEQQAIA